MDEYIKRENAINAIKQYAVDAYDIDLECAEQFAGSSPTERFCEGLFEAVEVLDEVPTADVAPRSEVARELKAFEGKVGRIYNHYVFEDTDYAEDDVAIEAVINALTEVLNDLSDLCQKYTEGEK